jgi:Tol biopolymer transport system component
VAFAQTGHKSRWGGWPLVIIIAALCACNLTGPAQTLTPSQTPTATASQTATATITFTPTQTPTASATFTPSRTPSITATASRTLTPTSSFTPSLTPTLTNTPYPTAPPLPKVGLAADQFARVTFPAEVVAGIGQRWLSYISTNQTEATLAPGTPVGTTNEQQVSIVSANGNATYTVFTMPASTGQRVYWSPNGAYLAYFLDEGAARGLYMLDLRAGISLRMFALDNLNPRGLISAPAWSPDSTSLLITLPTAYDVDLFSINPDGSNFRSLTNSLGFDFWGVWSPDSRYLAFVSDREVCPTWEPGAPNSCFNADAPTPDGGNLFIYDIATSQTRKLADLWVTEPPLWIDRNTLSAVGGTRNDRAAGSTLWRVGLAGNLTPITDANPNGVRVLRAQWSPDGGAVIYQEIGAESAIVLRDSVGTELGRAPQLAFPRFAFSAAWSPNSQRIMIGGSNSQCPYGLVVLSAPFRFPNQPPDSSLGACDPLWSPEGDAVAYTGVRVGSGSDGRYDIFLSNAGGTGTRNLTGRLTGQVVLLGWVGETN